ncbi:hypothetical protein N7462_006471 [Penicillium macrosclerotiorum]|uniref:uncharacterized protein n=1 Tax=Penicillium macrosclerotiorum TaxID=303699 RepID=UPI00254808E8|nr:uncharacterized protein N7462_006471 [Penicillium macrosclerotiorum]KAJ5683306.1 hypothetical protein N7462_006471 [Penicillium macrosclerotiorum]
MPEDSKGKSAPNVAAKLSALPKKSLFERQKAEAEAKRAREKAETAAVYEDFVKSFEDDEPIVSRTADGRQGAFGNRGGGLGGGPARRHFTTSGPRTSGPGSLGPPPPSLSRKRTLEGFTPASRNRDSAQGVLGYEHPGSTGPPSAFRSPSDDEDDRRAEIKDAERAAAKPTLYLASLPPGTSPSVLKSLIPSFLTVDHVNVLRPPTQSPFERKSSAAIVTLASDTAASDIDNAVSALQNKYLGRGYYLSLSRHLSSAAINSNMPPTLGTSTTNPLPFGAKNVQPTFGGSLNRAPPHGPHRGGFAPPSSYGPTHGRSGPSTQVEVKAPSDIKQLRLIHKTLENLLNYGPEFEALLMSRPEVQREEKWAWIWDARSAGGVYYRWRLWQIVTDPRARGTKRAAIQKTAAIFEGGAHWVAPESSIQFEYSTCLDEFVSDEDYNSSDEEQSDNEDERRNIGGGPPEGANGQNDGLGYMNPLQKAKLTHLLARLPTTHAKLRRGDVARVTAFAIKHAGAGADEVVDMIVLNVLNPLAYTGANPHREVERDAANLESGDKDNTNPSRNHMDVSSARLVGLYIISDILSSSATSGVRHAWRYRQLFENALRSREVFEHLGRLEKVLGWGRLKAEKWKRSVGSLLHMWEGWCVFPQSSQEHFVEMFETPPVTEEDQKEAEKSEAEHAASAFSKSKNRWKTVDDDPASGKFDPSRPAEKLPQHVSMPNLPDITEDESMSDIDGVPMEDSDLEMPDEDWEPMDEDASPLEDDDHTQDPLPKEPMQPEQATGQQEEESRRSRRQRPKAEDMFASESE